MIIYKLTSKTSDKSYIGQTKHSIEHRFNGHCNEANRGGTNAIHRAIRKHGKDDFVLEILEDDIETVEIANEREIFWISEYNSFKDGYNMTIGGTQVASSLKGKTFEEIFEHKVA